MALMCRRAKKSTTLAADFVVTHVRDTANSAGFCRSLGSADASVKGSLYEYMAHDP